MDMKGTGRFWPVPFLFQCLITILSAATKSIDIPSMGDCGQRSSCLVLSSWFEESLRSISYEKNMSWLLKSQLFMNFKALVAAEGLEPHCFGLLRLAYMFEQWLRIRDSHIAIWKTLIRCQGQIQWVIPFERLIAKPELRYRHN